MRRFLLVLMAMMLSVGPASAWGPQGHDVVASIGEKALTPAARTRVKQILQGQSLVAVANWADGVRTARPETAPWHYVNIPVTEGGYNAQRDCRVEDKPDNCVVAQITLKTKQLADPTLLSGTRQEALKWIVHFLGDIHQPMHTVGNGDRGGNDVKVVFEGHTTQLHKVWDSGIINAAADDHDDYAARLFQSIKPAERQAWLVARSPVEWVNETFDIAKTKIYGPLNLIGHPGPQTTAIVLGADYDTDKIAIVETQLKRAGIRLAALLETALVPPPPRR